MSKQSTGLGRGIDSLIPNNFDPNLLIDKSERIQNLFVNDILPNPDQPRRIFDITTLEELSDSIKQHGILQPLIVSQSEGQKTFLIIAGERRWRAAQLAGLDFVPAIVRSAAEIDQLEIALIENIQRVDLSPLEQAVSIERLHQQFNMTYQQIAEKLGKAVTTLNNIVRLLQLPDPAREALINNQISEGHARAILALKGNNDSQKQLLDKIIANKWSVRQAEQFVQAQKQQNNAFKTQKLMAKTTPATKRLAAKLGRPVSLTRTAKGGRLEIHFENDQQLERIINQLIK